MMGCDKISELPDSLRCQILLNLATKDSVKTSLLSTRWRDFWLNVPGLDLRVDDPLHGNVFPSFIYKYIRFNRNSRMQKFKIKYHLCNDYRDRFFEWISAAVDRGLQHLDVETDLGPYMPKNIYKSNTLVSLKLVSVGIETPEFDVSLPCLKIMHLEQILFDDDPLFIEKLISGSPVLEDLTMISQTVYLSRVGVLLFLRVRSQTLKSFRLTFQNTMLGIDFSVEIDAPRLEYLSFKDNQSDKIVIKNMGSLFMIDIDTEFNAKYGNTLDPEEIMKRYTICDFITGISSVRHMIISQRTIEVIFLYSEPVPKFDNLYRLQAVFESFSSIQLLPNFLESCPNLKHLILDFGVSMEPEVTELTYVPQCLLLSLECIEIRELSMEEETGKKLVRYFLENSVVLKKLILGFKDDSTAKQDPHIFKELRTFKMRSRKCQIIIH